MAIILGALGFALGLTAMTAFSLRTEKAVHLQAFSFFLYLAVGIALGFWLEVPPAGALLAGAFGLLAAIVFGELLFLARRMERTRTDVERHDKAA